ncbi:lysozyme inhibitor LprI family protein [Comamonas guangdongensis]|uniref:Lysozyme inhibitor LprI family protein n=1 Tax=Comamonas guangdongensis TaxID=510515 RepID=A0ABV3ZQQ3_9BURK
MKKLCLLLSLLAPLAALANSNCDKPVNDFDGLYCLNKVYTEADKELNQKYGELASKLDVQGKAALKQGQLAWIRERNSQCSRRDDSGFLVNLDCATKKTVARVDFLQSRIRECKSSGCLNSKLAE